MTAIGARTRTAALIDYGVGNIRSVSRVIESCATGSGESIKVNVTRDPQEVLGADLIMLPGVGSFNAATEQLAPWREDLRAAITGGTPTIAVCLGMQMLFESSDEGDGEGLGIFRGRVTRLNSKRVPHMGWNEIADREDSPGTVPWAYFAHSYACRPTDESIVAGWTTYEGDRFPSIIRTETILATQFHPEKSDVAGVGLIRDFISGVLS